MDERNKKRPALNRRLGRAVAYLREWPERHGQSLQDQVWRGVGYGVGSGAVSLLIVWFEGRF
ncbi:hypothetical protein ACFVEN_44305 [Streptomyces sp. NPDC057681]|uniref:hypothetical protein n=1 Tax=Streptomyces sp. NPDC057681 TaxID=3346209 RepID=UPI00367827DF